MSLRVWLPLTKDLRNQGLDDVTVTNNGATYSSTGGKLGGCYIFDGVDDAITIGNLSTLVMDNFSFVCWFYHDDTWSSKNYETIFGGPSGFELETKSGSTNSPVIRAYSWGQGTFTYELNKWNHLVMTRTTSETKFYLNGELKLTGTAGTIPSGNYFIGSWSSTTGQNFKGKVNDIRIYDHCLSPMEVKELAKGLVLHYPLNRNGWGQENLASQYIMPGGNKPGTTATDGRTNYYGDYGISIPATENADTYFSIWYSEPLESGATYTLSAEVSGLLSGSYYSFHLFAQDNTSMGIIKFNHNGLNTFTFTMNYTGTITTTTYNGKIYYRMFMDDVGRTIASGQGAITIKNIKLEKGDKATPWCPNSSDALATTMGLNGTTEYDCSGFCNNGTRAGTFSWTSDTPKYTVSTYMPKAALITHPRPVFGGTDQEWTCAMWVKLDNTSQGNQHMNNFNHGNQIIYASNDVPLLYLNSGNNDYYMYGSQAVGAGVWTHVVFVFKNSDGTRNVYINGVLKNRYGPNATSTPSGIPDTVTVGTNLAGYISDYRVYATALSADDVKSLYQNSAYIDSSGNVYGTIHES